MASCAFSVSALVGNASSGASTTAGDFFAPGAGPGASASVSVAGLGAQANSAGYSLQSSFTLTANTLLIFSASTCGLTAAHSLPGETAQGYATVSLSRNDNSQYSYGHSYIYADQNGLYSSLNPTVLASFVNLTAGATTGYAYAYAAAHATGGIAPVPEPETYALMLAGMLTIGLFARRRNTR